MKRGRYIILIFFLLLILFYQNNVFGAHSCRQECSPGSCIAGLVCRGNPPQCKHPDCGDRWDCVCKHANCKDLSGPTTVVVGETYTYSATYEDLYKPVIERGITVLKPIGEKNCDWSNIIFDDRSSGGAGVVNWTWTPSNPGRYVMFCRAWSQDHNGDIYECQGRCLNGVRVYGCKGPNTSLFIDVITPTPAYRIQGWKLLKQADQWITATPVNNLNISVDRVGGGYSDTKNDNPYYFKGPNPTPGVEGQYNYTVSAQNLPGASVSYTICYNNWQCYTSITPILGNSVITDSNRANSENYPGSGDRYVSIRWYYTPLIPNCKNIRVNPVIPLVGDTITITADYENLNGPVTSVGMVVNPQGSCSFSPLNVTRSAGAGTYSFNWTPTNAGNYDVFCRAWNDGIAECRGMCVDAPPRYQCPGSDGNGATSYRTITVQNPGPWYKLKDASLNKIGDHNIAVVQNVKSFDSDDPPNSRYTIINSTNSDPGILLATGDYNPGPSYNPIPDSTKGWHIGSYRNISQPMFASFYQYLKSRKQIEEITGISQINKNGIYFIKTDNLTISNQPPNYNFVLIVRNSTDRDLGNITININNFNTNNRSIMILSKDIAFSPSVTTASGIFIATNQFTYQSNNGLKILGNLISKNAVEIKQRSDNTRPSLFIVFKPKMYLDLLPYLSVSKYDWQQLQ